MEDALGRQERVDGDAIVVEGELEGSRRKDREGACSCPGEQEDCEYLAAGFNTKKSEK